MSGKERESLHDGTAPSTSRCPDSTTEFELLVAVERFLDGGRFGRVAATLRREIDRLGIVPKRFDFHGQQHSSTYEQFLSSASSHVEVPPLLSVVSRLSHLSDLVVPPSVRELPIRLLTPARNAIHRVPETIHPLATVRRLVGPRMYVKNPDSSGFITLSRVRELGVKMGPRDLRPARVASSIERQYRVTGHLAPIYCVLIDRTAQYILTGADDNLVKVWCARAGLLRFTMRGHSAQISDMTLSPCNTLLATCSVDKSVRVWSLQNGACLKLFRAHTAQISSIKWLPFCEGSARWFITTSWDCCIAFYHYDRITGLMSDRVHAIYERDVPGMRLCTSTHSPGGRFVAVGDSHSRIRMYKMTERGPEKLQELEGHSDRVDSLVWAHSGVRLASGSPDGTARVWTVKAGRWRHLVLRLDKSDLPQSNAVQTTDLGGVKSRSKYKITMLCWSLNDDFVITAGSDFIFRVWDPTAGVLVHSLSGPSGASYVLVPHPVHFNLLFTAGHDGMLMLWDIACGRLVRKWANSVEGIGCPALFDLAMADDGTRLAVVDGEGQLSLYGIGTNVAPFKRPKTQFFSTDYCLLAMDDSGHVIDDSSGLPPHLLPPPLLTDGNRPYPDEMQRLVPGRDSQHLRDDELTCPWITREIIPALKKEAVEQEEERSREIGRTELMFFEAEMEKQDEEESVPLPRPSNRPAGIRRRERALAEQRMAEEHQHLERREREMQERRDARGEGGEDQDGERWSPSEDESYSDEETSDGNEERDSGDMTSDTDFSVGEGRERRRLEAEREEAERLNRVFSTSRRRRQGRQRHEESGQERSERREAQRSSRRRRRGPREQEELEDDQQPSTSASSHRNRSRRRAVLMSDEGEGEGAREREEPVEEMERKPRVQKGSFLSTFPDWFMCTQPRRFPYVAQQGDQVVYLRQGHEIYLNEVSKKRTYIVHDSMYPRPELNAEEKCVVEDVKYTRRPYRLTVLRLVRVDAQGQKSGTGWTVRYHDMQDVPDFIVLKHHYEKSMENRIDAGDQIEANLESTWWTGTVTAREPFSEDYPTSNWYCLKVKWDSGEEERMSPWDVQPKTGNRRSEALATEAELKCLAEYQPEEGDWPSGGAESTHEEDRERTSRRIKEAIASLSILPECVPFAAPVDLSAYPDYPHLIDYPSDLSTVAERLHTHYYRRLAAVQDDLRYIAINAALYNESGSEIVRNARVLVETLIRFNNNPDLEDVLDLRSQIAELPETELTETKRKRKRDRMNGGSVSTAVEQSSADEATVVPGWVSECLEVFRAVLADRTAKHFANKEEPTEEMCDIWGLCGDVLSLSQLRHKVAQNGFTDPRNILEAVEALLEGARAAVDDTRSQIYRDSLAFGKLFETRISPIVSRFTRSLDVAASELGMSAGRLRRTLLRDNRETKHKYETRRSTLGSEAASSYLSRSGRPISHSQNGYYRSIISGVPFAEPSTSQQAVEGGERTGNGGSSAVTFEEEEEEEEGEDEVGGGDHELTSPDTASRSGGRACLRAQRSASAVSDESGRGGRIKRRPARYDSESDDSYKVQVASRSRGRAAERELLQEQQELVEDMEEKLSEPAEEPESEHDEDEEVDKEEYATTSWKKSRKPGRIGNGDMGSDADATSSGRPSRRYATRSTSTRSKRRHLDTTDTTESEEERGHRPRRANQRARVDYAEESDGVEVEESVSSRGRLRKIRRF